MYQPIAKNPSNVYLTLAGLYEYDNSIFDQMELPGGMEKESMIMTILGACGENECRYQSPDILKVMIGNFFHINAWRFNELFKTTQYDYDPLVNYDLEITVERSRNDKRTLNAGISSSGTSESQTSAYDSAEYSPERKAIDSSSNDTNETENTEGGDTETRHEKGDNSARSTQYMIKEQRDVVNFNMYLLIADEFEDYITIPVYSRSFSNIFRGGC